MSPRKNGCYNREPLGKAYPVQDGWLYQTLENGTMTRLPIIREQQHVLSIDCQYSHHPLTASDSTCVGCTRHNPPQSNDT